MLSFSQYLQEAVRVKYIPGQGNVMVRTRPTPPKVVPPVVTPQPQAQQKLTPTQRQQRLLGKLQAVRQNPSQELRNLSQRDTLLNVASGLFGGVQHDPETGAATYQPGIFGKMRDAFERGKALQGVDVQKTTIPIAGRITQGLLSSIANADISAPTRPANPPSMNFIDKLKGKLKKFIEPVPSTTLDIQNKIRSGKSITPAEYGQLANTPRNESDLNSLILHYASRSTQN
jgi:hypothetical protein